MPGPSPGRHGPVGLSASGFQCQSCLWARAHPPRLKSGPSSAALRSASQRACRRRLSVVRLRPGGGSLGPRPHGPGPRRLGESARSDPPGRASESASGDAQAADSTPHKRLPAPKSTFRRALDTPRPRWHVAQQSHGRIVGSGCHRPFKLPSEQRTVAGKLRRAAASASCQPWPDVQHNTARWLIRDSTQVGCKYVLRGAF